MARVVVVGAGPAGLYAASQLLKRFKDGVQVHILLPAPFGLVRYGVAPDHQPTKAVERQFGALLEHPQVHVHFDAAVRMRGAHDDGGAAVGVRELMDASDAVVVATGTGRDRLLGISNEHTLRGVLGAKQLVEWYNGYPNTTAQRVARDVEQVLRLGDDERRALCVVGVGNVALDIARLMLKPVAELAPTDIADEAVRALRESGGPRRVHVVGRRSCAMASFTTKEMRELLSLPGLSVSVNDDGMELDEYDRRVMDESRIRRRTYEAIEKAASRPQPDEPSGSLHFHFRRRPVDFRGLGDETDWLGALSVEKTSRGETERAVVGTGEFESIACGLAVRSIGYFGLAVDGVPFDDSRGVVPTQHGGRVVDADGTTIPKLYACGWLRRGASGIIGTNLDDAADVAAAVHQDWVEGRLQNEGPRAAVDDDGAIARVLRTRGMQPFPVEGWRRIDEFERSEGAARGKVREKLTDIYRMLSLAHGGEAARTVPLE